MKKQVVWFTVVVFLLTSLFTGCTGKKEETTKGSTQQQTELLTTTQETTEPPYTGGLPITSAMGTNTLTIAGFDNYDESKSLTRPVEVWTEMEKLTGIKVTFEVYPSSQYTDAMNTRIASGGKLPDIIRNPGGGDLQVVRKQNAVIDLTDLIEKYAPFTKQFFKTDVFSFNLTKSPDGIFGLRAITMDGGVRQPYSWGIRKDWLAKLSLQEPTTTDELYNVLKAFKERDPNGNSKADEIPFVTTYGLRGVLAISNAFGLHLGTYSDGLWAEDGKVQWQYIDPRAKDLLAYLNKLFTEGLLDSDCLNEDPGMDDKINQNLVGLHQSFIGNLIGYANTLKEAGVADVQYDSLIPVVNDASLKPFIERALGASAYYCITKDAKDTELAMKWLDFVYASEQGHRLTTWGIEGTSYVMKDGKPDFTDFVLKNPDGKSVNLSLMSLGALPTVAPIIKTSEGMYSGHIASILKGSAELLRMGEKVAPYVVPMILLGQPTEAESKILSDLEKAGLQTYKDEMYGKFITGAESLDKFDEFVRKMKEIGADKYVEVQQACYDRINK